MQKLNNIITSTLTNYENNLLDSWHLNKQSDYKYNYSKEEEVRHDRIAYKYSYI